MYPTRHHVRNHTRHVSDTHVICIPHLRDSTQHAPDSTQHAPDSTHVCMCKDAQVRFYRMPGYSINLSAADLQAQSGGWFWPWYSRMSSFFRFNFLNGNCFRFC